MRQAVLRQDDAFEADQVEARAIREGIASVASGALDDQISGAAMDVADELNLAGPEWNREQGALEELTGRAIGVVRRRQRALGDHYPFTIERSQLSYAQSDLGVYEFCLATCLATSNPSRSHRQLLRHFERLACELVTLQLGNASCGVRFGWPSERDFEEVPSGFSQRLDWMRRRCGFHEEEWTLQQTPLMLKYAERMNDAKIDFIVRCPPPDDRPGGFTFIGQCGCGKNDVNDSSTKFAELTDDWLKFFFATASLVWPTKIFATSQHLVDDLRFYARQGQANALFLDRIRLTLMAARCSERLDGKNQRWLKSLSQRVL